MIKGTKELISDLEKLSKVDTYKAVVKGIKTVQAEAKSLCPVGDGELRSSIYTSQETTSETVRGSCYTNKSYAAYVEFGTGPKGQANHQGISPDVDVVYVQSPWFYQCFGQKAHPYMYPALKNTESKVERFFQEAVEKQL